MSDYEFDEGPEEHAPRGPFLPDADCHACGKRDRLQYVEAYDFDGDRLEFYMCARCGGRWKESDGIDIISEVLERRENEQGE